MTLMVFAGTAQLGTLPLIVSGAPLWLIVTTALVLNLRFVIFSAAISPAFEGIPLLKRMMSGYLLVDRVFAVGPNACLPRRIATGASALSCALVVGVEPVAGFRAAGVLGAELVPQGWSLEFMATIALMTLLVPLAASRPMLVAALAGGVSAVALRGMPLKLGLIAGIMIGIVAGFAAEHWLHRRRAA